VPPAPSKKPARRSAKPVAPKPKKPTQAKKTKVAAPTPVTPSSREARGLPSVADTRKILERLRTLCMALPQTSERLSHGAPTWFIDEKRSFAVFADDHHADGRVALVCAAPEGMQAALVEGNPGHYYLPPYVAHQGWIGVRLDRATPWTEIAAAVEQAFTHRAPKKLQGRWVT
jgi:hypothetical protein